MSDIKPCPSCGSINIEDAYVFIKCEDCGMTGPKMNDGKYDDHADYIDHENAIKAWNGMPRRKLKSKFVKPQSVIEKSIDILDYANTIGKDIEVKCTPSKKSYFIASFETICEIKDGPILTSAYGFGSSVNDALKDLAKKISKKLFKFLWPIWL